jgi:plasmid stabilization system protein ParE
VTDVVFTRRAEADFDDTHRWYAARSLSAAANWLDAVERAIDQLESAPERLPLAPESDLFPIELRQLVFGGGRKQTHRLVFTIRPGKVVVYAVRHLAQRELSIDDLL